MSSCPKLKTNDDAFLAVKIYFHYRTSFFLNGAGLRTAIFETGRHLLESEETTDPEYSVHIIFLSDSVITEMTYKSSE